MNHITPGLPVHHKLTESTPNPCPLSRWCHLIISNSVIPFSSCPQSFPTSGSFQMSQLFTSRYWSFTFNISPSNEHPGLVSFRMDWLDLLEVQGTLKSLLQHHSSKASILWCSSFFIVQLSHPYLTTGKTIALSRWTFAGKIMSLLFRLVLHWAYPIYPKFIRAKDIQEYPVVQIDVGHRWGNVQVRVVLRSV